VCASEIHTETTDALLKNLGHGVDTGEATPNAIFFIFSPRISRPSTAMEIEPAEKLGKEVGKT
jgi:hypothetical protein